MKESQPFIYLGKLPNFEELLLSVSFLTDEDWVSYSGRRKGIAAEKSDTIPLMYDKKHIFNSHNTHAKYKDFEKFIEAAVSLHKEPIKVQQAILTRLKPGAKIGRHKDVGPITVKTHRIHIPVITNTECIFTVDDIKKHLSPGEVWIIDNVDKYHSVVNEGRESRVHLIIDAI
jgi:quercetin dioxygenase-like cupin family protein